MDWNGENDPGGGIVNCGDLSGILLPPVNFIQKRPGGGLKLSHTPLTHKWVVVKVVVNLNS